MPRPSPEGYALGTGILEQLTQHLGRAECRVDVVLCLDRPFRTNVAVASHLPTWFYVDRLQLRELPEDPRAREALLEGLELLASGR